MSLGTFSQLKTAVESYLHRTDLTPMLPTFVSLAEAKLNRRLRLTAQESKVTGTAAASVALPDDFAELISLKVTIGGSTYPVSYRPTGKTKGEAGGVYYYTTTGLNMEFDPIPTDASYTLTYYAKLTALEDADGGVNWLLTNAPDVYLYASLMEAEPYIKNDSRITTWGTLLSECIGQLEIADRNSKFGNNLRVVGG